MYGEAATRGHTEGEGVGSSEVYMLNEITVGVGLPIGIIAIAINNSMVNGMRIQHGKRESDITRRVIIDTAHKPIIPTPFLTCKDTELTDLSIHQDRAFPIAWHRLDETESVRVLEIVLRQIACHLQRRVEADEESELIHEGAMHTRAGHRGILESEDTRREVHGARHDSCERQDGDMRGRVASIGTPSCVMRFGYVRWRPVGMTGS